MLIVYDTLTGNTEKFVKKLPFECCHIEKYDGIHPFILVTYTINFGQVPNSTLTFLQAHHYNMRGVASGGNKNWGSSFAIAADKIAAKYNIPKILKFELQGTKDEVEKFIKEVKENVKVDRT